MNLQDWGKQLRHGKFSTIRTWMATFAHAHWIEAEHVRLTLSSFRFWNLV